MKKVIIQGATDLDTGFSPSSLGKFVHVLGEDNMTVSDGYHTFDELYEHRITLFIALCKWVNKKTFGTGSKEVWRSELHSDGSKFDGWFILGIGKEKGEQLTYHLPLIKWDDVSFAETLEKAPEFDDHTPADVLERLKKL